MATSCQCYCKVLNIYFQDAVIPNRYSGLFGAQWSGHPCDYLLQIFLKDQTMEIVLNMSQKWKVKYAQSPKILVPMFLGGQRCGVCLCVCAVF
jgi:hypothetical protein